MVCTLIIINLLLLGIYQQIDVTAAAELPFANEMPRQWNITGGNWGNVRDFCSVLDSDSLSSSYRHNVDVCLTLHTKCKCHRNHRHCYYTSSLLQNLSSSCCCSSTGDGWQGLPHSMCSTWSLRGWVWGSVLSNSSRINSKNSYLY